MKDAVLQVYRNGEWMLMGTVFQRGSEPVFYHKASATQRLHIYDSPGGTDAVVLDWLSTHGVSTMYHHVRESNKCYRSSVEAHLEHGTHKVLGGQDRYFLSMKHWTPCEPFDVPFVPADAVVRLKPLTQIDLPL